MSDDRGSAFEQPAEQLTYARWLTWCTRVGLLVLSASFAAYVLGWLPAQVPPQQLPLLWGLPVDSYLQQSGAPTGWHWLEQLGRGDVAAITGIVILAGCSVPALLALVPALLKRGDKAVALLCLVEVAVVVFAATGWLTGGH